MDRISVRYNHARAQELEGTYATNPGMGVWSVSSARTLFGWGCVELTAEVLDPVGGDLADPFAPGLDQLAKRHRIRYYQRVRNSAEAKVVLAQPKRVTSPDVVQGPPLNPLPCLLADFEITQDFVEAPGGNVEISPPGSPIIATHTVVICSDDEIRGRLGFANSYWGTGWGQEGRGTMSYDFFDENLVESWSADFRPVSIPQLGPGVNWFEWEPRVPLAERVHSFEFYDPDADERIGWIFATARDGFLDVEEIFVRPRYRGRGYGGKLAARLLDAARRLGLPLRAWIPFADAYPENLPALAAILMRLGLAPKRSGVGWAAYQALPASRGEEIRFEPIRIPARPTHSLESGTRSGVRSLRGTVLRYDDPFGPAIDPSEWESSS